MTHSEMSQIIYFIYKKFFTGFVSQITVYLSFLLAKLATLISSPLTKAYSWTSLLNFSITLAISLKPFFRTLHQTVCVYHPSLGSFPLPGAAPLHSPNAQVQIGNL